MRNIASVKEQVENIISEIHTGKPNTPSAPGKPKRPVQLGEEVFDFLADQNGPSVRVSQPKTVEKANVTANDIELLKRSFLPDRFKYDVALKALLEMEAAPVQPKKPQPKPAPAPKRVADAPPPRQEKKHKPEKKPEPKVNPVNLIFNLSPETTPQPQPQAPAPAPHIVINQPAQPAPQITV